MSNANDDFERLYNDLVTKLRELTGGVAPTFPELLDTAIQKKIVRSADRQVLSKINNVRAVIVHDKYTKGHWAEASAYAVSQLSRIHNYVSQCPSVADVMTKNPMTCTTLDSITNVLQIMEKYDFSQIPVRENDEVMGILTGESFRQWLIVRLRSHGGVVLADHKVAEVLRSQGKSNGFALIRRSASVLDVLGLFHEREDKGRRLHAVLVTENAKRTESLLGIVTVYDIPKMRRKLNET